ncbi:MAG: divergent polysaccharide deacetylase family protein [Bacillota bacterium]
MSKSRTFLLLGLTLLTLTLRSGPAAVEALRRPTWPGASVFCDARSAAVDPPMLAIVIDDLTRGAPGFEAMLALDQPLTFALFPDQPDAAALAGQVAGRGHEVILHLPMDAGRVNPAWYAGRPISGRQTDEEIAWQVARWLRAVPQARGMNNHMGTRATQDERVVRAVLEVARRSGKFVLDSLTTEATVVPRVAVEMGVPCMQRSLFLDHTPGKAAAVEQLRRLADWAEQHGAAIGIGHVGQGREATAQALVEVLPELQARGIRLVTLSTLLESRPDLLSGQRGSP